MNTFVLNDCVCFIKYCVNIINNYKKNWLKNLKLGNIWTTLNSIVNDLTVTI